MATVPKPLGEALPHGLQVYTRDGKNVGHVTVSALSENYFVVLHGRLLTRQLFLPRTAIHGLAFKGVILKLSQEELQDEQWRQPPKTTRRSKPVDAKNASIPPEPGMRPPPGVVLLPLVE